MYAAVGFTQRRCEIQATREKEAADCRFCEIVCTVHYSNGTLALVYCEMEEVLMDRRLKKFTLDFRS